MACGRISPEVQKHLTTVSSVVAYEWFLDWSPAIGADAIKAVLKNKGVTGNPQTQLAIQTATVRIDNPGAPALLDQALVGAGERCTGVLNIASSTGGAMFFRLGVASSLSEGSTLSQTDASLQVSYNACGAMIGASTHDLVSTTTSNAYVTVTKWVPAIDADKVKAAIIVMCLVGNLQCRLAYRTATTSTEVPSAWSTTFDTWRTANGEYNTGELALTIGSEMWVQFGIQYALSSGSQGTATVATAVGVRRS